MGDRVVPLAEANLSIASSAVLYGLSVYTVFPVFVGEGNALHIFRLKEHAQRLLNSARIIGIDAAGWDANALLAAVRETVAANEVTGDVFARATIHVSELLPGVRSRGLETSLSLFLYEAAPILPKDGARLKTSVWRRVPDYAIPSRAKVNGAYVNSVLARQDAIDSGYDDCVFLDVTGHVCELSAANLFLVRDGVLITPSSSTDILEGISRKTLITLAEDMGLKVEERTIDLTELYIVDEAFACGTSAYLTPVLEIDKRIINGGKPGPVTESLRTKYQDLLHGKLAGYERFITKL
jgi:branched-chain amino acid aminotransferase